MGTIGLMCLYGMTALDDIRTKTVRLLEIIIFGVIGIVFNIVYRPNGLTSILGGVGVGLCILLFSILSKEKIGRGDAYIIMVTGLYLGFMDTLILLWISSILASIVGIIMTRKYEGKMDMELPFVPFLLLGYILLFSTNALRGIVL